VFGRCSDTPPNTPGSPKLPLGSEPSAASAPQVGDETSHPSFGVPSLANLFEDLADGYLERLAICAESGVDHDEAATIAALQAGQEAARRFGWLPPQPDGANASPALSLTPQSLSFETACRVPTRKAAA